MKNDIEIKMIKFSIKRAILFMKEANLDRENFPTLASPNIEMNSPEKVHSVYIPTFIIHSLGFVKSMPLVKEIIQKSITFLMNEKEKENIWRFFGKTSKFPPPDFDDTCCALAALKENGIDISDNIFELLSRFKSESGLYYTWIDTKANKRGRYHTDGGINANILFYSGLCGHAQPEIINNLNTIVGKQKYQDVSIYSVSDYPVIYFITRAYRDANIKGLKKSMRRITKYLIQQQNNDGNWGNEIDTVLATISLLNAGCKKKYIESPIRYILKTQKENGGWPAQTFFQDFIPTYYGSEELTTAFCIEALQKYSIYPR